MAPISYFKIRDKRFKFYSFSLQTMKEIQEEVGGEIINEKGETISEEKKPFDFLKYLSVLKFFEK
jgi:hypothetical protein